MSYYLKTHGGVSSAARKEMLHTSVLFTGTENFALSTIHISITIVLYTQVFYLQELKTLHFQPFISL